jgi:hypothetical protein
MFKFLFGVAFGAAGYWAWQSFGRDLLGMGSDQETTYGGFSGGSTSNSFGSTGTSSGSTTTSSDATAPAGSSSTPGGSTA